MKGLMGSKTILMKRILLIVFIVLSASIFAGCAVNTSREGDYLLSTQWDQVNMYSKYCPDNNRAGCWSTAMAQILYHHRVAPAGKVDFRTTAGYKLSEDFNSYKFNWDLFQDKLDDSTSTESVDQVAKYIYYTSLVLEKDFSTGFYNTILNEYKDGVHVLNVDRAIGNLEQYYSCEAKAYPYTKEELQTYSDDIQKLIKEEIDNNRPLMMYIQSENEGHATVIDGYSYTDDKFLVHVNVGAGGVANKWYDFNKPIIEQLDDMNHRILITIKKSTTSQP